MTVKGPSPKKKQKRLSVEGSQSSPLGPDDFNLEAVVGKGGFGQVCQSLLLNILNGLCTYKLNI